MPRSLTRAGWTDSDGVARLAILCVACAAELTARRRCIIKPYGRGSGDCELCSYELRKEVVE